jgi:hypothetical protein
MMIPWIVPLALAAAVVLIVIRVLGPHLFRGTLTWHYSFRCPGKREDVQADLRESVWDGRRLDVERCSAFSPPENVRCDKACTFLPQLPDPSDKDVDPATR